MNIKIVSERTELTKRAIKYYEEQGLISPSKNNENNYREYNDDDIVKLNLIATLRLLDISISDIRDLLVNKKSIKRILKETLSNLNEQIYKLENSKTVISSIIDKEIEDTDNIDKYIKRLRKSLEYSVLEKQELLSNAINKIFPGTYGLILKNIYGRFFNVKIDTAQKKEAWLRLVKFLDNSEIFDEKYLIMKNINKMNSNDIGKSTNNINEMINGLLNNDNKTKEKYINSFISGLELLIQNDKFKENFSETISQTENMFKKNEFNTLDECLMILSDEYKKYIEITKELQLEADEKCKKKYGITFKGFIDNLKETTLK
ncbi:MAG: MerR family transcriptional regulator [Clostridiales bacterium]